MQAEKLKNLIAEWLEPRPLPPMIQRDVAGADVEHLSDILAIVGPRRAGKTYLMYQLIGDLLKKGFEKNDILFIDFEDYRLIGIKPTDMDEILSAFYQLTDRNPRYLFFDEIQNLPSWSRVLRTLHNQKRFKIIVSGSNSKLLSGEIASELRGRTKDLMVLPFSFGELLKLKGVTFDKRTFYTPKKGRLLSLFDLYLKEGGYPEVLKKQSAAEKRDLLQSYYRTIFYKDLLERHGIRSKTLLESVMRYCMETMGDLFSISRFVKIALAADSPASKKTVSNYLRYLQDAFFIAVHEKFDFSLRKRMMNPKKIYLMDGGFKAISVNFSENQGKFLENAVAVHLFRKGEEAFYFKKDHECDFIVHQGHQSRTAIQVCWELNETNRKREISGLAEAMRIFEIKNGLILTHDQESSEKIGSKEIPVMPAYRWMLEGNLFSRSKRLDAA